MARQDYSILKEILEYHECGWSQHRGSSGPYSLVGPIPAERSNA
jgi:hypothetical protein